jgi:predicted nucleic acid-binding protein
MILYVESNFILELAFLQSEHPVCTEILDAAAADTLTLVLPAFCISEPYDVLIRRKKQRLELYRQISDGTHELSRSAPYQEVAAAIQGLMEVFQSSTDDEQLRLDEILGRVLDVSTIIPTDAQTIRAAISYQQRYALGPQDAIIYASIIDHLSTAPAIPKCFVTKNTRDFDTSVVRAPLMAQQCALIAKFADGLSYLRSRAQPQ